MVWPDASRLFAFDDVYTAYRGAADAVDGIFIPAGDAWRAVWRRDPNAALYSSDGFHPSRLGSLVAALTVYATLFDADVRTLPNSIAADVPAAQFSLILEAVHEASIASRAGNHSGADVSSPHSGAGFPLKAGRLRQQDGWEA